MKKGVIIVVTLGIVIVALLAILLLVPTKQSQAPTISQGPETNISSMTITSPAFEHNGAIPKKYTCDGENINPELRIEGVPGKARSLVLIMDDPDAPGGTFTHWIVWSIWVTLLGDDRNDYKDLVVKIPENSVPLGGVEGKNSAGKVGYIGPCPPSGTHHYFFKIYALDAPLILPDEGAITNEQVKTEAGLISKAQLEGAMKGHILAQAELVGLYRR